MKKRLIASLIALGLLVGAALIFAGAGAANPPGIPPGVKLVYKWNLIGYPAGQTYDGNCGGGGRIFVNRAANNAKLLIQDGNTWAVLDCNATGDHEAILQSADLGTFDVYAEILGKPGGHLHVCADVVSDANQALCLLGTIDLTRAKGNAHFQLQPDSLFDASLEDILWTIQTNTDYRIVQFRVYEQPA